MELIPVGAYSRRRLPQTEDGDGGGEWDNRKRKPRDDRSDRGEGPSEQLSQHGVESIEI